MAANRWISRSRRTASHGLQSLRKLRGPERIGALALIVITGSLMLPWYGLTSETELVVTGWGAFSWAEAALMAVVVATAVLLAKVGAGYVPPRPLSTGALMLAAGIWAALIIAYRLVDGPELDLGRASETYTPRQGIVIALGGAVMLAVAGVRARRISRY